MTEENQMDWDNATRQEPKRGRAVVSVSFGREDFERIDQQAERLRVSLSEYIRSAALTRVLTETAGGLSAGTYYAPEPKIRGFVVTAPGTATINTDVSVFRRRVA
jgi:hypothetical protein